MDCMAEADTISERFFRTEIYKTFGKVANNKHPEAIDFTGFDVFLKP